MDDGPDRWSGLSNGYATFSQRSGSGEPVGSGGWNGLVTVGGKTVGPPTENGWQPFSVNPNGKHGKEEEEGDLRVPSFFSPLFGKRKVLLRERVVRIVSFEPPAVGLLGLRTFELPAVGLPELHSN